jgi:formate hydrogenlyase subunit 3/multisubunit Na+/H+ antiporter MnhD subunit
MNRIRLSQKGKAVIFLETAVFVLILAIIWLDEFIDIPYRLFGATPRPYRLEEYLFETVSIVLLAAVLITITIILQRRIRYLESFLHICAWCRRIRIDDKWISLEEYVRTEHQLESTHGICPECVRKLINDIQEEAIDSP